MENILAKKLKGESVSRSPISDTERLGDRFVRLLEKGLQPILKATVSAMVLDTEVTRLSAVCEGVPVPALLGVLGLADTDNSALANLSADLVFHIVDLRMGGDPEVCPTPTTRSFTEIDYALCRDIVEAVSSAFETATSEILGGPLKSGFTVDDIQQNITNVVIAPGTADVLKITVALDIGDAARGGDLDFVVPLSVLDTVRASVVPKPPASMSSSTDIWRKRMRRAVEEADIPINAVLYRAPHQTRFLQSLEVGQVLPIPTSAPKDLEVVLKSLNSDVVFARARLGAFEGKKVLKLTTQPSPEIIRHLKDITENA